MEERTILRSEIVSLHQIGDALKILDAISPHETRAHHSGNPQTALNPWLHGTSGSTTVTHCLLEKTDRECLCEKGNFERSSEVRSTFEEEEKKDWDPLLLWFRPRLCCIDAIGNMLMEAGLNCISSVGCGSGLLEWLLAKLKGIQVTGYEVNETWWVSTYSPPKFIPHVYVDEVDGVPAISPRHALFCCYFNNGFVLQEYLNRYEGNCLIVIGSEDSARRTDPRPLEFVDSNEWKLQQVHAQGSNDLICCYHRSLQ